ncbi:MAG TPA: ROK family protein [Terriglobia bacterium]|nr:ROK family protein [Terriglobia bacterium]
MNRFAIGADLGGTNLRLAAIEENGRLIEKVVLEVRSLGHRDAAVEALCQNARVLARKHGGGRQFAGLGAGIPGILDAGAGILRQSPNLPGWENFAVREALQSRLEAAIALDNDANAAALGETWLGAGRTVASLCLLTLGTGIGGGLVLDGKVWRGFLGMAGEVGHIGVRENGEPCGCGSRGCLETEASATAVVRKARQLLAAEKSPALAERIRSGSSLTAELVYQLAQEGDAACRDLFASVGRFLGLGLSMLVNTLNLPLYLLGGGMAEAWPLFAPALLEELGRRSYVFAQGGTRVERAQLGADAGLYGAAALVLRQPA